MVTKTVELSGDQIEVHADIGPGRIVKAILFIENASALEDAPNGVPGEHDPFGEELDRLLAMTTPVAYFVDDSREAIYTPDDGPSQKNEPQ